ncbi:MAG: hypothetical protein WBM28_00080 [Burkholderiales bacterium]
MSDIDRLHLESIHHQLEELGKTLEDVNKYIAVLSGPINGLSLKMGQVGDHVGSVGNQIGSVGNKLGSVGNQIGAATDQVSKHAGILADKASELIKRYDDISRGQERQQRAVIALTAAIALATIAYTVITAWSVTVMRDGNDIQRRLLDIQQSARERTTPPPPQAAPAPSATPPKATMPQSGPSQKARVVPLSDLTTQQRMQLACEQVGRLNDELNGVDPNKPLPITDLTQSIKIRPELKELHLNLCGW